MSSSGRDSPSSSRSEEYQVPSKDERRAWKDKIADNTEIIRLDLQTLLNANQDSDAREEVERISELAKLIRALDPIELSQELRQLFVKTLAAYDNLLEYYRNTGKTDGISPWEARRKE